MPPGPGQFDLIYCNEVLEHVEDDSALVGELVGYLAPGGSVVGTTPVGRLSGIRTTSGIYDEALLKRALAPWGRVRVHRYYRSPLRNFAPGPAGGSRGVHLRGHAADSSGRTLMA